MADLFQDYLHGVPALMERYADRPESAGSHAIPPRPWAPALVRELTAFQTRLGGSARFQGDEAVVITGQQPGIFTGPLYTIYKAITAIKLAQSLAEETGTPFVPLYWVGGDDHDFDEIRRVHLLNRQHAPVPLELHGSNDNRPQSIFQLPVDDALHELADRAAQQATGSEFSGDVRAFLHESLDKAANLSEWHALLMARLFRDTPLAIFTPDLHAARREAIPIFEREIRHPLASTKHVNEGGARLEAAGYGAQVVKGDDTCNFFLESHGMRCGVRYTDGIFYLPDTEERFDESALLALLHASPERFTANVALRCVLQQHLFPVRAYVAGPGELVYWGQFKGVFEQFGLPMPVVYPRVRNTITSVKTNKLLAKYGLTPANVAEMTPQELEERALRTAQADPALEIVARHRTTLETSLEAMQGELEALGGTGKTAAAMVSTFRGQVGKNLEQLERNILHSDEQRTAAVRGQLDRLTAEIAPERKPQERYYTVFSWLFQHGFGLVPRLLHALDHRDFTVQEVEL